jgi:hypothetical protein
MSIALMKSTSRSIFDTLRCKPAHHPFRNAKTLRIQEDKERYIRRRVKTTERRSIEQRELLRDIHSYMLSTSHLTALEEGCPNRETLDDLLRSSLAYGATLLEGLRKLKRQRLHRADSMPSEEIHKLADTLLDMHVKVAVLWEHSLTQSLSEHTKARYYNRLGSVTFPPSSSA